MVSSISNGSFAILDQNFEMIAYLDHYEELMWVDKYDEVGEIEIKADPTPEILEAAQMDNYIWSSLSDRLMIIDSLAFSYDASEGIRYLIKGHSLEVILRRRVLLYKTVFKNNLEDCCRQIVDWGFMRVTESGRKVDNFTFEYSGDPRISSKVVNYEYEPGTELLTCIQDMCQGEELGFKITLNESTKQFVFKLFIGEDRSYAQEANPWVVFSPTYNNLISDKIEQDAYDHKNFVFVVGEEYTKDETHYDPEWIRYGTGETGLYRREVYESAADINHEIEEIDGTKIELTDAEYTAQLNQRATNKIKELKIQKEVESQVDPNVNFEYGKDYFIGDVVQLENAYGFNEKARVSEFIIDHNTSGLSMYPTFKNVNE